MLIPIWTDSEIRYLPFATGILIALNIAAYAIQMSLPDIEVVVEVPVDEMSPLDMIQDLRDQGGAFFGDEGDTRTRIIEVPGWEPYALSHGDGLHPVQWLTSFFMHGDIMHLLGNMIFLWVFGMVVEGRAGPMLFSLLYMGMGIFQNIVEQVLFLPFDPVGPSLGASSAIYAIMMVAMLWTPKDNIKALFFLWFRGMFVDVPVAIWAVFYFLWDFGAALFSGFSMSTPLLHAMGGAVGLVVGLPFVLFRWVDCEERDMVSLAFDLFGVQRKAQPKALTRQEKVEQAERIDLLQQKKNNLNKSIEMHLRAGNIGAAIQCMKQLRQTDSRARWRADQLLVIVKHFTAEKQWDDMLFYSQQFLDRANEPVLPVSQSLPGREQVDLPADPFSPVGSQPLAPSSLPPGGSWKPTTVSLRLNMARILLSHKHQPRKALTTLAELEPADLSDKQRAVAQSIIKQARQRIADGEIELS